MWLKIAKDLLIQQHHWCFKFWLMIKTGSAQIMYLSIEIYSQREGTTCIKELINSNIMIILTVNITWYSNWNTSKTIKKTTSGIMKRLIHNSRNCWMSMKTIRTQDNLARFKNIQLGKIASTTKYLKSLN